MSDIYKLCYKGNAIIVDRLPLSKWTIVDTGQLSINGNTITQNGIGGWCESMYISFTVPETGFYEISYDYDIANAVVGGHGTYGFGLWLTTNNPHVTGDAQYNFYANSNNRNGPIIGNTNQNISGMKGHKSYKTTLNAGTTYYLWYPGAALNDGTTFTLSFTNINVFNDPVQYDYVGSNILTYPNWNGYISYEYIQPTEEVWVNLGSTEYSQTSKGTKTITLTGMPSSSNFNYFTLVLDAYIFTTTANNAILWGLRDSSNAVIWLGRAHRSLNNRFGFVGITGKVTGWTTQSGVTVTSDTQDGTSYRCSSLWSDAYKRIKFVFDRNAKRCYFYMSGTLLGYATLNVDAISLKNLYMQVEQGYSGYNAKMKNIRVAGFSTLDAAKNYNG